MNGSESNPYESPKCGDFYVPVADATMGDPICRWNDLLIVRRGSEPYLPCDTCFKCGGPAVQTVRRTFYWHHPCLYALVFLLLLPYFLFAVKARKKMELTVGLCAAHAASRRRLLTMVVVMTALGLVALFPGALSPSIIDYWRVRAAGVVLLVVSMALAFVASNGPGQVESITDREGAVAGAGEGYLRRFPPVLLSLRRDIPEPIHRPDEAQTEAREPVPECGGIAS